MEKLVYGVYDTKSLIYGNPFVAVNRASALRDFHRAATDPNSLISSYPDDYILFEIGTYDDTKGVIMPLQAPINLGFASQTLTEG